MIDFVYEYTDDGLRLQGIHFESVKKYLLWERKRNGNDDDRMA